MSLRSKDPKRQVGAVILRPDRSIVAAGYNGFARGVCDDPELYADVDTKNSRIIHAEMAAILTAQESLRDCTLYVNRPPCSGCAAAIIQKGIKRVVTVPATSGSRWTQSWEHASAMFQQAQVSVDYISRRDDNITHRG
jgi:dCMP deaminase